MWERGVGGRAYGRSCIWLPFIRYGVGVCLWVIVVYLRLRRDPVDDEVADSIRHLWE